MADNSDDSGDLFRDGVQKRNFLHDTKRAAACTVNDIRELIMQSGASAEKSVTDKVCVFDDPCVRCRFVDVFEGDRSR